MPPEFRARGLVKIEVVELMVVCLTNGERVQVVKSMKLDMDYFLMLVKDEQGERVQVFSSDEIESIETEPETEARAA